MEEVRYDGAFTFVYSPRRGTEAAAMPDQVPEDVKRERIERLIDVVQRIARARNEERVGRVEEVLVEGPSRTDPSLLRGRTRRNTTVNFAGTAAAGRARPRDDRGRDLDDAQGHPARSRCRVAATSSGTAVSTSATSAACRPWTAARRAAARSCAQTACGC